MSDTIETNATKEIIDGLRFDVSTGAIDDEESLEIAARERCAERCLSIGELRAIDDAVADLKADF